MHNKYKDFELFKLSLNPGDILIEANAGSGKSYNLLWFAIRLMIEKKVPSSQIVILSFTKKTAAELKLKINLILQQIFLYANHQKTNLNETELDYLKRWVHSNFNIENYFAGFIGTIHSFAHKIICEQGLLENDLQQDPPQDIHDSYLSQAIEKVYLQQSNHPLYHLIPKPNTIKDYIGKFNQLQVDTLSPSLDNLELLLSEQQQKVAQENDTLNEEKKSKKSSKTPPQGLSSKELYEAYIVADVFNNYQQIKDQRAYVDYCDLIKKLKTFLIDSSTNKNGPRFSNFRALLVDEFQDTDQNQVFILKHIFNEKQQYRLFVGDPKQSIYRFRGADLGAYLRFRDQLPPTNTYALTANYRSTVDYIAACNQFFTLHPNPFDNNIAYQPSVAANTVGKDLPQTEITPCQFLLIQPATKENNIKIDLIRHKIVMDMINHIHALVAKHKAMKEEVSIAILVNNNKFAAKIQKDFRQQGLYFHFEQNHIDNNYNTIQSCLLTFCQLLINQESNYLQPSMSFLTDCLINLPKDVAYNFLLNPNSNLNTNHAKWLAIIADGLKAMLNQGLLAALQLVFTKVNELFDINIYQNHVWQKEPNRSILNSQITRLSMILDEEIFLDQDSIKDCLQKFSATVPTSDSTELANNYDYSILTIHKAKGLEFDYVFCPALWEIEERQDDEFSRIDYNYDRQNFAINYNLLQKLKPTADNEESRLIYTALTRAKLQSLIYCPLVKMPRKKVTQAKIWEIMNFDIDNHNIQQLEEKIINLCHNKANFDYQNTNLEQIKLPKAPVAQELTKTTSQRPVDIINYSFQYQNYTQQVIEALKPKPKIASFSSINDHLKTDVDNQDIYWINYLDNINDQQEPLPLSASSNSIEAVDQKAQAADLNADNILPQGKNSGLFIHDLLDKWNYQGFNSHDFEDNINIQHRLLKHLPALNAEQQQNIISLCEKLLDKIKGLKSLDSEITLFDSQTKKISEWEFYIKNYTTLEWNAALDKITSNNKSEHESYKKKIKIVPDNNIYPDNDIYLSGKIDLICEVNDKIYLVDWKTNTIEDYTDLESTMIKNGYYLQALIYTHALQQCWHYFDSLQTFDSKFGGCFFIFIRGLLNNNQKNAGIFFLTAEDLLTSLQVEKPKNN